jgi:predicted amidophosphoribosyltransferase
VTGHSSGVSGKHKVHPDLPPNRLCANCQQPFHARSKLLTRCDRCKRKAESDNQNGFGHAGNA